MKHEPFILMVGFIFVLGLFLLSSAVLARVPMGEVGSPPGECLNLWWRDNTHSNCSEKKFCGAFLYEGLMTFDSQSACQIHGQLQRIPSAVFNPPDTAPKDVAMSWPKRIILQVQEFFASILVRFFPSLQNNNKDLPTNKAPVNNTNICELSKEYESTTDNPVSCKCPSGYDLKAESVGESMGYCPKLGRECPVQIFKCLQTDTVAPKPQEQPVYNCGGFMGTQCPSDYRCKILGGDAGTCVK